MLRKKSIFEKFLININDYKVLSKSSLDSNECILIVQNISTNEVYIAKTFLHYINDELFFLRFYKELYKLIRCQNPTLIHFIGYSLTDFEGIENPVIILERQNNDTLEKQPLSDFKQLTSTQRQIILIGIARAMMILHNNRIIYYDIKPSNIIIDTNFHPLISEFCFLNFFEQDNIGKDHPTIFDSLAYMAPEALESDDFNYKSDVFSFSILMYEVITGNKPYPQIETKNMQKLKNEIINGYRPSFDNMTISQPIKDLICQCWSNNLNDRPSFDTIFLKLANLEGNGNVNYNIDNNVDIAEINNYIRIIYKGRDHFASEDECMQNIFEAILHNNKPSNEQLMNHTNELQQNIEKLKLENQSLLTKLEQEKKNNFELKTDNELLRGKIKLEESNTSLKITENEVLKNRLELVEKDLVTYKLRCMKYKEQIETNILNTNINVSDYFSNRRINNRLIKIPSNSYVERSISNHPLYLPTVSIDDNNGSDENDQLKDQIDSNVQNKKVFGESDSITSHNFNKPFNIVSSFKENTQSSNVISILSEENPSSEVHDDKISIVTIDYFNNLNLDSKKSIISSMDYSNSSYLKKIDDFLSFLLNSGFNRSGAFFEILTTNSQEDLNHDINEFQIHILPHGTESLINDESYDEQHLNGILSQFNDILFDIKYSSETFKSNFYKVMKMIKSFGKKAKIALTISGEIDKNLSFYNKNESIYSIYFDDTVTVIKESSFQKWKFLKKIHILAACSLEKFSFSGCTSLEEVFFKNLKSIEKSAFQGCTSLKKITIPSSTEKIGDNVFQSCTKLTDVIFEDPCEIKSLCNNLFFTCTSLKQISIPLSVAKIGASAFCKCGSLEEIKIPASVKEIGTRAFFNCSSLKSIIFDPSIQLVSISDSVFLNCSSLSQMSIPNTVDLIGFKSFGFCTSLCQISIPPSVKSIGNSAFEGCQKLQNVLFENITKSSLESIGEYAFSNCSLKTIECPVNAKIESNSFPSSTKITYKVKE